MMIVVAIVYAKRYKACQTHADFIHQPPERLHPTSTSWPFEAWGMNIVGPITPPSVKGHRYILAITDYFSKWAEAILLVEVKTVDVVNFIKHHVIYRFGVPRRIIHNNGPQFASHAFYRFCNKYWMQNIASTAYNPATNGLAEAFNKTIIKLLKKFVSSSKRD
jgi:transposase InsO family protein